MAEKEPAAIHHPDGTTDLVLVEWDVEDGHTTGTFDEAVMENGDTLEVSIPWVFDG